MSEMVLTRSEYDSADSALDNILSQTVESIALSDTVPLLDDVADSNKVFRGKLSVLFVDMRKSTDLTDELKSKKMVKVYRAFIRMTIQAIRYSGGFARQFAGDGIMGVFQDTSEGDSEHRSSQKAVDAARYIITLIDYCLNPALKKHIPKVAIGCGVGICTGDIMITKVGMRGKEADESSENETGIVWVGSTTNYASRFCGLAAQREIFIDEKTYSEIPPCSQWQKASRTKGNKLFSGYIASEYYLPLSEDMQLSPVKSEEQSDPEATFIQSVFEETQVCSLLLVDEISKKSAELAVALENLKKRELLVKEREDKASKEDARLRQWQARLDSKQSDVDDSDERNKWIAYNFYKQIFASVHCKEAFAIGMEKSFWAEKLTKLIECGREVGKSEKEVRSEICYALVSLYQYLEMYDEAYNALCIQAETHSWIHASTVEAILEKTYLRTQLKDVIEQRLKTAWLPDIRKALEECLTKIK